MLTSVEKIIFLIILTGSIAYFVRRIRFLVRLIRLGKADPDGRGENLPANIRDMLLDVILQRRVLRKPVTGILHLLIVWGFFVFAVNTVNHFIGAFFADFHLFGNTVLAAYYTALADLFAVLVLIGVLGLAIRRYVFRPASLTPKSIESAIVFFFIGGAMAAYLFANATKIALAPDMGGEAHIVAARLAGLFRGMDALPLLLITHFAWWCDAIMHLMLIALLVIPTKHLHLAAGPLNLVFKRRRPSGQMVKVDLEDESAETFGVSKVEDFTWKQNLDLYACIECGRCRDYCPTANSGKALNPKELIVNLKSQLLKSGPALLASGANGRETAGVPRPPLIGEAATKEVIWACTTCGSCVEHCPMGIEHIDKITDMRTALVLMEADFPQEAAVTFKNMETAGNPWGFAPAERAQWADGLDVPVMSQKKEADILWWVGCSGSYDERCKKVSRAMAHILKSAEVDYAILGEEERCNCESARRLGNEYLYQTATQEIIETLKQYSFKRVLTTCPHCYNTFKNDYSAFGERFNVISHVEFLRELIDAGSLRVSASAFQGRTAYHDSCYLGRHNGVYSAPREVLESAGCTLAAVPREKDRGFCCGAGGGQMWLEETGDSIAAIRAAELVAAGADQIAAACPFCITMLGDGLKKNESSVEVKDIAEILAEGLFV